MKSLFLAILPCFFIVTAFSQVNLNQGLIGYFPFNGDANDRSGNGNNPTFNNGTLVADRFGNSNQAYWFDGVTGGMTIPGAAGLNTATALSIALYFNPETTNLATLIGKIGYTTGTGTQFQVAINWSAYPGVLFGVNDPANDCYSQINQNSFYVNTGGSLPVNQWYCLAATFEGGVQKIYLNGALIQTLTAPFTTLKQCTNSDIQIGSWWQNDQQRFKGRIDDVRIYNRALTQAEVTALCTACSNPTADFNYNLVNCSPLAVQFTPVGSNLLDPVWDFGDGNTLSGTLNPVHTYASASNYTVKLTVQNANCKDVITKTVSVTAQPCISTAQFTTPDTVCVNTPVNITNTSTAASTYYWNFCVADITAPPSVTNIGNPGNLNTNAVFMDYVYENGNYYGFVVSYGNARLVRLDFGNSLLNTPTAVNLGNYGGLLQNSGSEGIQVVQNNGRWYALIVGGTPLSGTQPRIVKIDFGTNITSAGTATNWGNLGNMNQPVDLHVFKEGNNWYGLTVNAENNTITRFDFTNDFNNTPTGVNLGNVGNLLYPTGIFAINDNGFWRVFITNAGDNQRIGTQSSLTRLDFGSSLLNTPTGVNLGNPGGMLHHPRDLTILKFCGQITGFAVNGNPSYNNLVTLNFNNDLTSTPTISNLGNTGNYDFPHSITRLFRVNDDVYTFIINAGNNTLSRLRFAGCTNASISSSTLQNPAPVSYSAPGTYNINLTIDDGLATQNSFCKQVVVLPQLTHSPTQTVTLCAGNSVKFGSAVKNAQYTWNTGATTDSISITAAGTYWVQTDRFGCSNRDSIIVTVSPCTPVIASFTMPDTVCVNTPVTITNTSSGASSYYWTFCTGNLNSPPIGANLGKVNSALTSPVYIDYVQDNGNYYGFMTDNYTGNLFRLEFGNSLLNTPTTYNLGDFGSIIPDAAEGIQVIKNEGKWYAIIVGGTVANNTAPRILKIEFGANITNNTPLATNWGNIGGLAYPHDLYVFQDNNNNWYGLTVNSDNSTITRFDFTNSFSNTPTGVNLGNVGTLTGPTGIYAIKDGGNWYAFVTNANSNTLTRLDFGNSLLNTPTGTNLGNPGNQFHTPWDIQVIKYCGDLLAYVINADQSYNSLIKLNFNNNITSVPTAVNFGNVGNMQFPHCLSKIFRAGSDLYSFVPNVANQTLTRLSFQGCGNASIPNSTAANPGPVSYNTGGTYVINVTVDDGLPTQTAFCKQLVVLDAPVHTTKTIEICTGSIKIGTGVKYAQYTWNTGATTDSIIVNAPGTYWVQTDRYGCSNRDTIIVTHKDIADFYFKQDICNPLTVQFFGVGTNLVNPYWSFGDGNTTTGSLNTAHTYTLYGNYTVKFGIDNGTCKDTITKNISVNVTNSDIVFTPDTTICFNSTAGLRAKPALSFCWSPTTYLSNSNTPNPVTSTPGNITYYYTAEVTGNNLITNGDFSNGNTGFTSQYNYANPNLVEGQYFVGTNPQAWNSLLGTCTDHTTGSGNMLLVNGATQANVQVYTTTVTVTPNTNYAFSTWLQNVNVNGAGSNPPRLQFSINGNNIGNILQGRNAMCIWDQFYTTWNSGNNTTATIAIVNQNTLAAGNDYALDDISFAPVFIQRDSVKVMVDTPIVKTINDTAICKNSPVPLQAGGATSWLWSPATGLSSTTISNPVATPLTSTQYIVTGTNARGCLAKDTVQITVLPNPVVNLGPDVTDCAVNQVLDAGNAGAQFLWQNGATAQTFTASSFGKYYVQVTDINGCVSSDTIVFTKTTTRLADFTYKIDVCNPLSVQFTGSGANLQNPWWSFGDGNTTTANFNPAHTYAAYGDYPVQFGVVSGYCKDTITQTITVRVTPANLILTPDTTICFNATKQLRTQPALSFCWSPTTWLNNANVANPVTSTPGKITYYYTAEVPGANLIVNGDFSNGNTGFSSSYTYSPSNGFQEGVYTVGSNPMAWHPAMPGCKDHTTGSGNMLLVNGATTANVGVWTQTVPVTPNTNYAFSTWLQHVTTINPALLQFSINGKQIGNTFRANSVSCIWDQFYTTWNSGNNTSATISILNQNTVLSGNDFALDDISFAPVFIQRDSVIISVDTPIVKTNNDTTICVNSQVQLQASGAATWSWTPATGLSNAAISNPIASPAANTSYIVTGQTIHGCTAKDTVAISLHPVPTIITDHELEVCPNTPVPLAANTAMTTYSWTPAATLNNPAIANPMATPGKSTQYKVQVTDAYTCPYSDSVMVQVRTFKFSAGMNAVICKGSSITLQAIGGDQYLWSPAGSLNDATRATPVATPDTTTLYQVNIRESDCGSDTTFNVRIVVNPTPVVKAEKINDIDCLVHSAKLMASGSAGNKYVWTPARGLDYPNLPDPVSTADTTTKYYVTGSNQYGCAALDSVTVYVTATGKVSFEVPNAFTPNGDGLNDCLGVKSWGGVTIDEFSIFNRWGERVFTTNKPGVCWDGRFRGEPQPAGGYTYIIKAKTYCGPIKRSGVIMLLR